MLSGTNIVITGLAATQTLDSRPCHPGFEAPGFEAVVDRSAGHHENNEGIRHGFGEPLIQASMVEPITGGNGHEDRTDER